MDCKHEQFRCTNCLWYCLKCGQQIPNPYEKAEKAEEKKPAKRRTKKGDEQA